MLSRKVGSGEDLQVVKEQVEKVRCGRSSSYTHNVMARSTFSTLLIEKETIYKTKKWECWSDI